MKRNKYWILAGVATSVALLIIAGNTRFQIGHTSGRRAVCQSRLKQVAMSVKQYTLDYDELYPRAQSGDAYASLNTWVDVLQPFAKSQAIFQCPADEGASGNEFVSYGYNSNLSALGEDKIENSGAVVLNFEVNGSDLATCGNIKAGVTASTRHQEGSNFSFADGHVKWFKPGKVSEKSANGITPSFIVK